MQHSGSIKAARRHQSDTLEHQALLIAAIIMYSRPFSANEKEKIAAAESRLDEGLVPFKGEKRHLHDRIIKLRNKTVAHAESTAYPVVYVPSNQKSKFATVSRRSSIVSPEVDLNTFAAIAFEMMACCVNDSLDLAAGTAKPPSVRLKQPKRRNTGAAKR
jgi:hypothetical protein